MPSTFDIAKGVFTDAEFAFLLQFYLQAPPELADRDFAASAARAVNTRFRSAAASQVSASDVARCIADSRVTNSFLFSRATAADHAAACTSQLALDGNTYAAAPVATVCIDCRRQLQPCPARSTFFYPSDAPAAKGRLYSKQCRVCNILYEVDGFTRQGEAPPPGCTAPAKRPYAAHLCHTEWDQVSRETVIHVQLYKRFDAGFFIMRGGYYQACSVENFVNGRGAR